MARDDIKKMMVAAGAAPGDRMPIGYEAAIDLFEKFAALVAAAEREECAKACEAIEQEERRNWVPGSFYDVLRRETAALIRARRQSGESHDQG